MKFKTINNKLKKKISKIFWITILIVIIVTTVGSGVLSAVMALSN